jgi:hypothetical protein
MRILSTLTVFFLILITSILLIIPVGESAPLAVSNIYIEPTGYEDPSTQEWKGSFWIVTAIADTKEAFLFYCFNKTEVGLYGQNKIGNKTIIPTATIKITITPRKPYWERQLQLRSYLVYPKTYGTYRNYITKQVSKLTDQYVEPFTVDVLECDSSAIWTLHTPFDVTIEKFGPNSFSKSILIDTIGGKQAVTVANPSDPSEKMMILDLGKIGSGYGQPATSGLLILDRSFAFERTDELVKAIKYGRDLNTGQVIQDENFAFYWFGGGKKYLAKGSTGARTEEVQCWGDDKSPAHWFYRGIEPAAYPVLVSDDDFPGSYRKDGPNFWDERVIPIPASIANLTNYLRATFPSNVQNLNLWNEGYDITSDNKLRIYMPTGAAYSLITIKISSELADSVVYQPIVANGKVEQAFWDSTKTTRSVIRDKDYAILKVKQYASQSSKITVTPTVPANIPVSVSPQMDSAIVDPNAVHTFQFEIRNLGTQNNQSSTITFTVTNDLGNVTDTVSLDLDLIVTQGNQQNPPPNNTTGEGDPLWIWLAVVISITIATASIYTIYTYRSSQKAKSNKKANN